MLSLEGRIEKLLQAGALAQAIRVLTKVIKEDTKVADTSTFPHGANDREFSDVSRFHLKFQQLRSAKPTFLTKRKAAERANFMLEELWEFADAAGLTLRIDGIDVTDAIRFEPDETKTPDMELQADALIDIVYVAKGTAVMMGLPWEYLWRDVQRANMAKELGETRRSRENPGQHLMDVTKPPGWVPPHTNIILSLAGFDPFMFAHDDLIGVDDAKCLDDPMYKESVRA